MSSRQLRSASGKAVIEPPTPTAPIPATLLTTNNSHSQSIVQNAQDKFAGLSKSGSSLLRKKQKRLEVESPAIRDSLAQLAQHFQNSLASTLIFAQESAGTAVCISASGLVLTCAHCIAEDESEYQEFDAAWLLDYTGQPFHAKCLAWDPTRDLALLQIITADASVPKGSNLRPASSFISIALANPKFNQALYCIGQPGQEDMQSETRQNTAYNLVEISHGYFRGNVSDADPQDNSKIGTMKHSAWTYWGHSGAPLINSMTGDLIGLHSSWDDQTAMRHGVPVTAIREFLQWYANKEDHPYHDKINDLLQRKSNDGDRSSARHVAVLDDTLLAV